MNVVLLLPTSLGEEIERMINSFWWGTNRGGSRGINWLRWEKMTVCKDHGGLGFRNFHAHNLAMLGKQGWKFISHPEALVSRIFKAKYYPRGDFLDSKIGHNPSFVWRSIWTSRTLLREGLRWRVGNGSSIKVWTDPWLRIGNNFRILSTPHQDMPDLYVHDLILPQEHRWNMNMLASLFCHSDISAITSIPLIHHSVEDKLIWHYNQNGVYSVKSGYKLCMQRFSSNSTLQVDGDWNMLWKLQIPPNVKMFLWRACHDCLPTRSLLQNKGVNCSSICILCQSNIENCWHILITCPANADCWKEANLWPFIEPHLDLARNFTNLFFRVCSSMDDPTKALFSMMLWSLWKKRNVKLWEEKETQARQVFWLAIDSLHYWKEAKRSRNHMTPSTVPVSTTWAPPPTGYLKCNIDASFSSSHGTTGIGICIRDETGSFVAARTFSFTPLLQVHEGECMGLLQAITWVLELDFNRMHFEMDSKLVVDGLHNTGDNFSEFGIILDKCKELLSHNPNFHVKFSRRQANMAAHVLSRVAIDNATPNTFNSVPTCIADIIHMEMK